MSFEVRVTHGPRKTVQADKMTTEGGNYCFWVTRGATNRAVWEQVAAFPEGQVLSAIKSSLGTTPTDDQVIERVVEVFIICVVEKARADGTPLTDEQVKKEKQTMTTKLKEIFDATKSGVEAVKVLLDTYGGLSSLVS